MTPLSILFLGFFLGLRHATDADHVIAVTTIVTQQRKIRSAALTGIFWGIGHSLTLLLVGGAIILFGVIIPQRMGMGLELGVAGMLVVLGIGNLRGFKREVRRIQSDHAHPHLHFTEGHWHEHTHGHASESDPHPEDFGASTFSERMLGRLPFYRTLRPAMIGVVHGLAGSAAVALLVLPVIRNPFSALAYLLIFGLGTIVGMMSITAAIAVPIAYSTNRFQSAGRYLGAAAGVLSLVFGAFLFYQIGFVDGLFTR